MVESEPWLFRSFSIIDHGKFLDSRVWTVLILLWYSVAQCTLNPKVTYLPIPSVAHSSEDPNRYVRYVIQSQSDKLVLLTRDSVNTGKLCTA